MFWYNSYVWCEVWLRLLHWYLSGKESTCQCRRQFQSPVKKIPWRRKWLLTLVFFPGKSHEQRSLAGYSPRRHKESDTTEWLNSNNGAESLFFLFDREISCSSTVSWKDYPLFSELSLQPCWKSVIHLCVSRLIYLTIYMKTQHFPEGCDTCSRTERDWWATSDLPLLWLWKLPSGIFWGNCSPLVCALLPGITATC